MTDQSEGLLIGENGRPRFGLYPHPLSVYNLGDLRPYGKKTSSAAARIWLLKYRIKRWQFLGLVQEELVFGLAVVRLGYLCNLFAYLFERGDKRLHEQGLITPGGGAASFQGTSSAGEVLFQQGKTLVRIRSEAESIHLEGSVKAELAVDLFFRNLREPLVCLSRVGLKGFNYTHKEAGLSVEGWIRWRDRTWSIDVESALGVLDYTLGLPARRTFWNWAAGGGRDKEGNRIGFNLAQGINETGFTENAFWINGRLVKSDVVHFHYDDMNLLRPWRIESGDGRVRLHFRPEGSRSAQTRTGFISSRFHQPFGRFEGIFMDGKTSHELEWGAGFAEEHFAKW